MLFDRAGDILNAANAALNAGDAAETIRLSEHGLNYLAHAPDDHPYKWRFFYLAGEAYRRTGNGAKAFWFMSKAYEITMKLFEPAEHARCAVGMARIEMSGGKYGHAAARLSMAIGMFQSEGQVGRDPALGRDLAYAIRDEAVCRATLGDHTQAVQQFERAAAMFDELGLMQAAYECFRGAGQAMLDGGEPAKAAEYLCRALGRFDALPQRTAAEQDNLIGLLAKSWMKAGTFDEAIHHWEQEAEEAHQNGQGNREFTAVFRAACACYKNGQYARALPFYERLVGIGRVVLPQDVPELEGYVRNVRNLIAKQQDKTIPAVAPSRPPAKAAPLYTVHLDLEGWERLSDEEVAESFAEDTEMVLRTGDSTAYIQVCRHKGPIHILDFAYRRMVGMLGDNPAEFLGLNLQVEKPHPFVTMPYRRRSTSGVLYDGIMHTTATGQDALTILCWCVADNHPEQWEALCRLASRFAWNPSSPAYCEQRQPQTFRGTAQPYSVTVPSPYWALKKGKWNVDLVLWHGTEGTALVMVAPAPGEHPPLDVAEAHWSQIRKSSRAKPAPEILESKEITFQTVPAIQRTMRTWLSRHHWPTIWHGLYFSLAGYQYRVLSYTVEWFHPYLKDELRGILGSFRLAGLGAASRAGAEGQTKAPSGPGPAATARPSPAGTRDCAGNENATRLPQPRSASTQCPPLPPKKDTAQDFRAITLKLGVPPVIVAVFFSVLFSLPIKAGPLASWLDLLVAPLMFLGPWGLAILLPAWVRLDHPGQPNAAAGLAGACLGGLSSLVLSWLIYDWFPTQAWCCIFPLGFAIMGCVPGIYYVTGKHGPLIDKATKLLKEWRGSRR